MSNKKSVKNVSIDTMYDIIDVLQNNLRFPELASAVENLNKFDRDELENDIMEIVNGYISKRIEDARYDGYNDGYEKGFNECYEESKQHKEKKGVKK